MGFRTGGTGSGTEKGSGRGTELRSSASVWSPEEHPEDPKGRASATPPASPSFKNAFRVRFSLFALRIDFGLVSIELRTAAYAAPYLDKRHCHEASINPPHCSGDLSDIIEAEQPTRSDISSQAGTDPPE